MLKIFKKDGQNLPRLKWQSRLYGALITAGGLLLVIVILAAIKVTPFAVYESRTLGFRIKYPELWQVIEQPQGVEAVIFVSPAENEADEYRENVNVTTAAVNYGTRTLDAFTATTIRQLTGLFEENIEVLQSRPYSMGGRPGHLLVFSGKSVGEPAQYLHVWCIAGTKAYIITYTALKKDFDRHFRDVLDMVKSFRLL